VPIRASFPDRLQKTDGAGHRLASRDECAPRRLRTDSPSPQLGTGGGPGS
jgi:hypothetical protein